MHVLGIETSCDDTAVAIVGDEFTVAAHALSSQIDDHRPYGGVVPEIAARSHLDSLDTLVNKVLTDARCTISDLDGIAVTAGPGLIGGILVGMMTAKALAAVHRKPFLAVNHLEGHALTVRFTNNIAFPYLLLLASGGHCQFLIVRGVNDYTRLGTTLDDAAGECFDKVAKMLGLGFPGGPAVEAAANNGDPSRFDFPRPLKGRLGCDLSFSGLKTAVRHCIQTLPKGQLATQDTFDIAASVQTAIVESLIDRASNAIDMSAEFGPGFFVAAGGVAANKSLREALSSLCEQRGIQFVTPPQELCTDNAIMIAWAGIERLRLGLTDSLDFKARPRWPLDTQAETGA